MIFAVVTMLIAVGEAEGIRRYCREQLAASVVEAGRSAAAHPSRPRYPGPLAGPATPATDPLPEAA